VYILPHRRFPARLAALSAQVPAAMADSNALHRALVLEDGSAWARFADQWSLFLHAGVASYTALSASGARVRGLVACAPSHLRARLAQLVFVVNSHSERPVLHASACPHPTICAPSPLVASALRRARWDARARLRVGADGVALQCSDGSACLTLDAQRRFFRVSFALPLSPEPTAPLAKVAQVFPLAHFPLRWAAPLQRALAAAASAASSCDEKRKASEEARARGESDLELVVDLPPPLHVESGEAKEPGLWTHDLVSEAELLRLHASPDALPEAALVFVEWTPLATHFAPSADPAKLFVETLVHADSSALVLVGEDAPVQHLRPLLPQRSYAPGALPARPGYDLAAIGAAALRLWRHSRRVRGQRAEGRTAASCNLELSASELREMQSRVVSMLPAGRAPFAVPRQALAPLPAALPALSSKVLAESVVGGVGRFTAFEDGRVRVHFFDRAIAQVPSRGDSCEVLLPDGDVAQVSVAAPAQSAGAARAQSYAHMAWQFRQWALSSPAERAEREVARRHAHVQAVAELTATRRLLAIRAAAGCASE
jgi:hypothetical protein